MGLNLAGSLTHVLPIEDESHIGHARRTARKLAEDLGFDDVDAGRVSLVATELASNILKHAVYGEIHLRGLPGDSSGVEVIAVDRGPGFDPQHCLTDGFSTRGTQGIGLGAALRQAQVFDVHSDERGSVLLARFYPRQARVQDRRYGVSQHSLHNDPACGDLWAISACDQKVSVLVIDGLGHGPVAEEAALAGADAFTRHGMEEPGSVLDEIHQQMRGTRGGAVAVAQYDGAQHRLQFNGIGNIGAMLIGGEKPRGLASHPGIVGLQFRRVPTVTYPDCGGQLLILYSDGLQSRWNLHDYAGLSFRHPAIIAAVLHRDYCRGKDDVTVLVITLETFDDRR